MKLHQFAAAALLVGTSALAFAPKTDPAPETTWEQTAPATGDPDLDLAENPDAADTSATGVGGPLEPAAAAPAATTIAAADLTVQPATQNYPACDPGPGDDNCIQLYEPGVRVALASWNQPTGGLIDGSAPATAVGGPYEPAEGGTAETAMNGDGAVDTALGETADSGAKGAAD